MKRIAASLVSLFMLASIAGATTITFNVTMTGSQEVPPNASPAIGNALVVVDDVANSVFVSLSFSGLVGGSASAAHIHCCALVGANAPVVIPFSGFPNATSGTYSNTFTGVSPTIIAGIEAYRGYVNIHDATFPGGEIRAQLVPEPASMGLAAIGLALVAARLRRRG
jgi:hypothetical protein